MLTHESLGQHLSAPSVSYGSTNFYLRGALEEETRPNLEKTVKGLIEEVDGSSGDGAVLTVNDKKLVGPMRLRLKFNWGGDGGDTEMAS